MGVANIPAYYDAATIMGVKSFIAQAPGGAHFSAQHNLNVHHLLASTMPN